MPRQRRRPAHWILACTGNIGHMCACVCTEKPRHIRNIFLLLLCLTCEPFTIRLRWSAIWLRRVYVVCGCVFFPTHSVSLCIGWMWNLRNRTHATAIAVRSFVRSLALSERTCAHVHTHLVDACARIYIVACVSASSSVRPKSVSHDHDNQRPHGPNPSVSVWKKCTHIFFSTDMSDGVRFRDNCVFVRILLSVKFPSSYLL